MPFARPNLSTLRARIASDINAGLSGIDSLLRYANLRILGDAFAGIINGLYGYLDWIAKQAVPFTATDEYLEGWAALKGVVRKPATASVGVVTFNASSGTIPQGAAVTRSDGVQFLVVADAVAAEGIVEASVRAAQTGAGGNTSAGITMTLASAISGISSLGTVTTALVGGADVELDDAFKSRMIAAYSHPPQGGSATDYVNWALAVPGVTRAWAVPGAYGPGSVGVLFMMDDVNSEFGGFPQGTDGAATAEARGPVGMGDQLMLADALFTLQPVTALVLALAPTPNTIALTIAGLSGTSSPTRTAILAAFKRALQQTAVPGGSTPLSAIEAAIAAVTGTTGFVITAVTASAGSVSPGSAGNITSNAGALPIAGAITYT